MPAASSPCLPGVSPGRTLAPVITYLSVSVTLQVCATRIFMSHAFKSYGSLWTGRSAVGCSFSAKGEMRHPEGPAYVLGTRCQSHQAQERREGVLRHAARLVGLCRGARPEALGRAAGA